MILKEFRELRRDRRTLAMLIAMPLLLLVVFGYAANFSVDTVRTAVVGPQAEQATTQLPAFFDVTTVEPDGNRSTAEDLLQRGEIDVAFVSSTGSAVALVDGSNLFAAQSIVSVLNRLSDQVTTEVLYNPELKTSWVMIPAIIGLILTFIGTIITSIGLVRERQTGTLEQLAVMPIKPSTVNFGKIAPYFLVASIDMAFITVLGMWLFDVPFNGNPLVFALGGALFLFVVLGLGVFISTVSQNAEQAIQLAFFFLLPQILLSGMIFPLDAMAAGVRWIAYFLPLTYFTMISRGVMLPVDPVVRFAGIGTEPGDGTGAGETIFRRVLALWDDADTRAPLLALLRTAVSHERAAAALGELFANTLLAQVATPANREDSSVRAALVASHIGGLVIGRYVLRLPPLAGAQPDEIAGIVGPVLDHYLSGELARPTL